jgi:hypothetical protein
MRRIRVVFSIGAMHGGGSERQMILLLRHLDRTLFEPHLYLVYKSGPLLDQVPTDVPVVSFDTRVTPSRIYLPGLMHSRRVRDYARYLQEVQADVSYDRTFLMTLISAAGAQRAGVPNVSTIVTNPETGFAPVAGRLLRQPCVDGSGGRGWTERSEGSPGVSGCRPPTPATHQSIH